MKNIKKLKHNHPVDDVRYHMSLLYWLDTGMKEVHKRNGDRTYNKTFEKIVYDGLATIEEAFDKYSSQAPDKIRDFIAKKLEQNSSKLRKDNKRLHNIRFTPTLKVWMINKVNRYQNRMDYKYHALAIRDIMIIGILSDKNNTSLI